MPKIPTLSGVDLAVGGKMWCDTAVPYPRLSKCQMCISGRSNFGIAPSWSNTHNASERRLHCSDACITKNANPPIQYVAAVTAVCASVVDLGFYSNMARTASSGGAHHRRATGCLLPEPRCPSPSYTLLGFVVQMLMESIQKKKN